MSFRQPKAFISRFTLLLVLLSSLITAGLTRSARAAGALDRIALEPRNQTALTTAVLDDFNRADGALGGNWSGATSGFALSSNQVSVNAGGNIYWQPTVFGVDQEAYVTLTHIDPATPEINLVLKGQSSSSISPGQLSVSYSPSANQVQIWSHQSGIGWRTHDAPVSVVFADGDQFGAKARSTGQVEIYKNNTLVGVRSVTDWGFYSQAGYIGFAAFSPGTSTLDNFGGGTIPGAPTATATFTPSPVPTTSGSTFPTTSTLDNFNRADGALGANWAGTTGGYAVASNRVDVGTGGNVYWQGAAFSVDQEVFVTLTQIDPGASEINLILKAQSGTSISPGQISVLYSPSGNYIQIWTYSIASGWQQLGHTHSVVFSNGDQFGAKVQANGQLTAYRNGTVLSVWSINSWPYSALGGFIGFSHFGSGGTLLDDFGGGNIPGTPVATPTTPSACTDPTSCSTVEAIQSAWRCNIAECTSADWIGAVIAWPSWSAYQNNARTGDNSRSVYSMTGEPLYPYMGSWADGCTVTAVSGITLIIEWQRGTDVWRSTFLEPGQSHTIDLIAPEDNALIEAPDGSTSFSVSLSNCTPQNIGVTPTASAVPSATPSSTPTSLPTSTLTATLTSTATNTSTSTFTPTPSRTPTATLTASPTNTATATATSTLTATPTASRTNTPTVTATRTNTPTVTATRTNTPTVTATRTNTPDPCPFVVTNTNDSGAGSLRQAILNANSCSGTNTVTFNIAGAGPYTISLTSALPTITGPIVIDGWSQPGFAGTPLIELNGTSAGTGSDGLRLTAGGSTIRGLIINKFNDDGIEISTNGGNSIVGNFVGTNRTGTSNLGNGGNGIEILSASNTVGGLTASSRNIISGNNAYGISITGATSPSNIVQGNYVGVNAAGNAAIGNALGGVYIAGGADNNVIGGTTSGARNVISGNGIGTTNQSDGVFIAGAGTSGNLIQGNYVGTNEAGTGRLGNIDDNISIQLGATNNIIGGTSSAARNIIADAGAGNVLSGSHDGVYLQDATSTGNLVQGNYIGTDVTGTLNLSNGNAGVRAWTAGTNTIGGTAAGAGNLIVNNSLDGVELQDTTVGIGVLGNSIHSNSQRGIDMNSDGVTSNDGAKTSGQPNLLMDYPVFTAATLNGSALAISGYVGIAAGDTDFGNARVEIFLSDNDASGNGEGRTYLGFLTTDATDGDFSGTLTVSGVNIGNAITATATDSGNNTSEFGPNFVITADAIFAEGFASGNLSGWTANVTDGGDLTASTAAAMAGTYGMQAVLDDNDSIYVTDETPNAEARYRARFYFDPNSISMSNGNAHYIFYGYSDTSTVVARIEFRRSSGVYQLRTAVRNDGSSWTSTSWITISDARHYVEIDWRASSSSTANNGGLTLWIDGVQSQNLTGIDNDTRRITSVRLGAVSGVDGGTRGTYYFDSFESRRLSYIGP